MKYLRGQMSRVKSLLLLKGTGKSLNPCSPKMVQENLNWGGQNQRAMSVILDRLFQMLLALQYVLEKNDSCIILGNSNDV